MHPEPTHDVHHPRRRRLRRTLVGPLIAVIAVLVLLSGASPASAATES